jgi:outer membrane biosynthesis protein TonB
MPGQACIEGHWLRRLTYGYRTVVGGAGLLSAFACGSDSSMSVTSPSSNARCAVTATTDIQSASAAGSSGALTIGVNRECSWTANADVEWIAFGGATSGQGPATIPFTVAPNTAVQSRRARLAVNDQLVEITQAARVVPPPNPPAPPPAPPTPPTTPTPPSPTPTPPAPTPPTPTPPTPAPPTPTPPAPTPPTPAPPPPAPPAPGAPPAPAPPASVELEGKVSDLTGTCPAVTFTVERRTVRTTAQTSISGGNCSDIKDKAKIAVRGVVTSGDVVAASSITIVDKDDENGNGGKSGVP